MPESEVEPLYAVKSSRTSIINPHRSGVKPRRTDGAACPDPTRRTEALGWNGGPVEIPAGLTRTSRR